MQPAVPSIVPRWASSGCDAGGPPITLSRDVAVPFGLVLHELASNAVKYGSLPAPDGSVDVTWMVGSEIDVNQLRLTWRERGGPPVSDGPMHEGFGTKLIEQSLPKAEIERRFDPEGLICTIKFKLCGKLEQG